MRCTCSDYQLTQVGCDCGAEREPVRPLTARRAEGGRVYDIFALTPADLVRFPDAARIGRLTASGFFISDDRELGEYVQSAMRFAGRRDLPTMLKAVRNCYNALCDDRAAEARAEQYAENAWLRAAEAGTPESWAEEARDRDIEFYGYGPAA